MTRGCVGHQAKVGQEQFRRIERAYFRDGFAPRFDVHLWRDKRGNRRPISETNAGDVTAKDVISPLINGGVPGVAWRLDPPFLKRIDADEVPVLQTTHALGQHARATARE